MWSFVFPNCNVMSSILDIRTKDNCGSLLFAICEIGPLVLVSEASANCDNDQRVLA